MDASQKFKFNLVPGHISQISSIFMLQFSALLLRAVFISCSTEGNVCLKTKVSFGKKFKSFDFSTLSKR